MRSRLITIFVACSEPDGLGPPGALANGTPYKSAISPSLHGYGAVGALVGPTTTAFQRPPICSTPCSDGLVSVVWRAACLPSACVVAPVATSFSLASARDRRRELHGGATDAGARLLFPLVPPQTAATRTHPSIRRVISAVPALLSRGARQRSNSGFHSNGCRIGARTLPRCGRAVRTVGCVPTRPNRDRMSLAEPARQLF